jgi:hypothetical protein
MRTGLTTLALGLALMTGLGIAGDGIQGLVAIAMHWQCWVLVAVYFGLGYTLEREWIHLDTLVDPITGQPADGLKTWSGLPPIWQSEWDQDQ